MTADSRVPVYEPPRLVERGGIVALTFGDGDDPCRWNDPRNDYKQTGEADLILGQAGLIVCSA